MAPPQKKGENQADLIGQLIAAKAKAKAEAGAIPRGPTPKKVETPKPKESYDKPKAEWEANQELIKNEKNEEKRHFIQMEMETKLEENKPIDEALTWVPRPGKDPEKIPDVDKYWVQEDLKFLSFLPQDEDTTDQRALLDFLRLTVQEFETLLKMPFNVFWCHILYTEFPRVLETYLRFGPQPKEDAEKNLYSNDIDALSRQLCRSAFFLCIRSSKRGESSKESISTNAFPSYIQKTWNVPMLIDFCVLYGETNADKVSDLVSQVLISCPELNQDLKHITSDMREALSSSLSQIATQPEVWEYLLDCLECIKSLYLYFTLEENLKEAELDLQRLLNVYDKAYTKRQIQVREAARSAVTHAINRRYAVSANDTDAKKTTTFNEFEAWLQEQDSHLLEGACWKPVFEKWKSLKITDNERIDYFLRLSGAEVKDDIGVKRVVKRPEIGTSGAASSSAQPRRPPKSVLEIPYAKTEKINRVKEVLSNHGDGWIYLCLEHYNKPEDLINASFIGTLATHLAHLSTTLTLPEAVKIQNEEIGESSAQSSPRLEEENELPMNDELKKQIFASLERQESIISRQSNLEIEYEDEPTALEYEFDAPAIRIVTRQQSDSEDDDEEKEGHKDKWASGSNWQNDWSNNNDWSKNDKKGNWKDEKNDKWTKDKKDDKWNNWKDDKNEKWSKDKKDDRWNNWKDDKNKSDKKDHKKEDDRWADFQNKKWKKDDDEKDDDGKKGKGKGKGKGHQKETNRSYANHSRRNEALKKQARGM